MYQLSILPEWLKQPPFAKRSRVPNMMGAFFLFYFAFLQENQILVTKHCINSQAIKQGHFP
jgi:hypothetical protein